jgi:hypothetical protein
VVLRVPARRLDSIAAWNVMGRASYSVSYERFFLDPHEHARRIYGWALIL